MERIKIISKDIIKDYDHHDRIPGLNKTRVCFSFDGRRAVMLLYLTDEFIEDYNFVIEDIVKQMCLDWALCRTGEECDEV